MHQSAPGPSGLRADHLLLAFPSGLSDSLVKVLDSIIRGKAPRWLTDARLFALPKKAGGVRPIAVGETLRRLAAAVLLRGSLSLRSIQLLDGSLFGETAVYQLPLLFVPHSKTTATCQLSRLIYVTRSIAYHVTPFSYQRMGHS